jgi:hypothetical protein
VGRLIPHAQGHARDALTPAARQVRIEAAFSTLRMSSTVDEHLDWSSLELLRELGHGAPSCGA